MPTFDEVEHTADWAFHVQARNLRELFELSAAAMFALQGQTQHASGEVREVEVRGLDRETLLVNWLNELLYLQETTRRGLSDCSIVEMSDTHLRAQVSSSSEAGPPRLIKAVTFHNLNLQQTADGWETTIVVDV